MKISGLGRKSMALTLTTALYGKDKIRVFRVVRDGKWHKVVEYNVTVLVDGNIGTRCASFCSSLTVSIILTIADIQLHGSR
jgi:hypothetical protein